MERSISHVSTHSECKLYLLWEKEQQPASLHYRVRMIGAKPPNNYFVISLNPPMEGRFYHLLFLTSIRSICVVTAVSNLMYTGYRLFVIVHGGYCICRCSNMLEFDLYEIPI